MAPTVPVLSATTDAPVSRVTKAPTVRVVGIAYLLRYQILTRIFSYETDLLLYTE